MTDKSLTHVISQITRHSKTAVNVTTDHFFGEISFVVSNPKVF